MKRQRTAPYAHRLELVFEVGMTLADVERRFVERTLDALGGNKLAAAKMLGISRRGLYIKLAKWEGRV